ncbi:putative reverse transcriptase domain-containing protein [Tanacetum coccineum]
MSSPYLIVNRVGSIVPFVKPLDIRKFESASYQSLGACFNPYRAFLKCFDTFCQKGLAKRIPRLGVCQTDEALPALPLSMQNQPLRVRDDGEMRNVLHGSAVGGWMIKDKLMCDPSACKCRNLAWKLPADIYDHVIEIPLLRIKDIETGQGELESRSLITGGERASLLDQVASLERSNARLRRTMMMEGARADRRLETFANMTITRYGMTPEAIEELINRRVEKALAAYEATRAANALEAENQSQNGSDGDNGNGGDGNGRNENGGNGNPNENNRDARHVARECTYQDFMKCQPLNFKGTEGVVWLTRWLEKMETVFHISNCPEKYQVRYATCTLLNSALTWWNSHKRTIRAEAAFSMSWRELMTLMAEVYCPRNEIQKMKSELWNLTVKNNDLAAYTQRFQELTMLCTKIVSLNFIESNKEARSLYDGASVFN